MPKELGILVDETGDGLEVKLQNAGYRAKSVKKLRLGDEKFGNDYNIMRYVEENGPGLYYKRQRAGTCMQGKRNKMHLSGR